ncbi:hypothetical protein U1Q18_029256 [Sarracenia purpurea var. burkii]
MIYNADEFVLCAACDHRVHHANKTHRKHQCSLSSCCAQTLGAPRLTIRATFAASWNLRSATKISGIAFLTGGLIWFLPTQRRPSQYDAETLDFHICNLHLNRKSFLRNHVDLPLLPLF